jgi:WD40 repeat protein
MCCDVSQNKVLTGSKDGKVYLWNVNDDGLFSLQKKYKGHTEPIVGVCLG